jgi:hypothetical protein
MYTDGKHREQVIQVEDDEHNGKEGGIQNQVKG